MELFIDTHTPTSTHYLALDDLLSVFPDGHVPDSSFEHKGRCWQLQSRTAADGRVVHLAMEVDTTNDLCRHSSSGGMQLAVPSPNSNQFSNALRPFSSTGDLGGDVAIPRLFDTPRHGSTNGSPDNLRLSNSDGERRKFMRNLLNANNRKEPIERYKSIMSLIEHCKRRARDVPPNTPWSKEPAQSLLQSIMDVGEALASFGNCHFPEHSNEARAILAGDYRRLLREYLSNLGGVFTAGPEKGLAPELEVWLFAWW